MVVYFIWNTGTDLWKLQACGHFKIDIGGINVTVECIRLSQKRFVIPCQENIGDIRHIDTNECCDQNYSKPPHHSVVPNMVQRK